MKTKSILPRNGEPYRDYPEIVAAARTETKHTPVPWKLDEQWALIMGPKREEIAAIHAAVGPGRESNRQSKERAQANARLIVRAVNSHADLMLVVAGILSTLDEYGLPGNSPAVWTDNKPNLELSAIWKAARAALAKAKE